MIIEFSSTLKDLARIL